MANIYSKPVSSDFQQTYVSQHVPLPLEQFARAQTKLEATQTAEENQLASASNAAWNINGVVDADNEYVANVRDKFDEAATKLAGSNLTLRENQEAAKTIVQEISRDRNLATIMSNAAKVKQYQEDKKKMEEAGTYQSYNDNFIPTYQNYNASGGYKSGKSIDTTIHKYSEERPKMEEYFNNMGENGADSLGKIGETYYKTGWEGVSKNQATSRAYQAFQGYLTTPEGQQGARRYNYLKVTNPSAVKGIKNASEYVFNQFLDAGLERVHGKSTSGLAAAMNEDKKAKKEEANLGTFSSTGQNTTLGGGYEFTDSDYDDNGKFTGSGKGLLKAFSDNPANPGSALYDYFTNKEYNKEDPKDQRKALIHAAATLNNKIDKEYYQQHAGDSMKLTTSFKTIPSKKADAYQKQFFNPETGTGVFDNATVLNARTGERGKLSEILRLAADRGELKDEKGNKISLSSKPTASEVRDALKKAGVGIKGENNSNYFSPKSLMLGVGNQEILWDRTNNMDPSTLTALQKAGELTPRQVAEHNFERIKTSPEIEGEGDDAVIHYYDDKSNQILTEKLNNIK